VNEDRWPVRVVVGTLATVVLVGLCSEVALTLLGKAVPDQIDRIVNIALGAIGGILSRTSRPGPEEGEPTRVEVVADHPVPVTETPGPAPATEAEADDFQRLVQ
jgi:hypothetical protein